MSCIHYKFKSSLEYATLTFDGLHITLGDLKKLITQAKKLGKSPDFDLQITNAQTKQVYSDDDSLIPKNSSVIVSRVPIGGASKALGTATEMTSTTDTGQSTTMSPVIPYEKLAQTSDLASANASEEDKIRAMMAQSTRDYDQSNYVKSKYPHGPPSSTYVCFKCGKAGHFINNCPNNLLKGSEPPPPRVKRSTGIPQSFMRMVDNPHMPGAMVTSNGQYAVPYIDMEAYQRGKKEKPPFLPTAKVEPVVEDKPSIPGELLCQLCKDILKEAVVINCCGNSFCDECIREKLLETEEHQCPQCGEKGVSPDNLIPNNFLRKLVINFENETGYMKPRRRSSSGSASGVQISAQPPQMTVHPPQYRGHQPAVGFDRYGNPYTRQVGYSAAGSNNYPQQAVHVSTQGGSASTQIPSHLVGLPPHVIKAEMRALENKGVAEQSGYGVVSSQPPNAPRTVHVIQESNQSSHFSAPGATSLPSSSTPLTPDTPTVDEPRQYPVPVPTPVSAAARLTTDSPGHAPGTAPPHAPSIHHSPSSHSITPTSTAQTSPHYSNASPHSQSIPPSSAQPPVTLPPTHPKPHPVIPPPQVQPHPAAPLPHMGGPPPGYTGPAPPWQPGQPRPNYPPAAGPPSYQPLLRPPGPGRPMLQMPAGYRGPPPANASEELAVVLALALQQQQGLPMDNRGPPPPGMIPPGPRPMPPGPILPGHVPPAPIPPMGMPPGPLPPGFRPTRPPGMLSKEQFYREKVRMLKEKEDKARKELKDTREKEREKACIEEERQRIEQEKKKQNILDAMAQDLIEKNRRITEKKVIRSKSRSKSRSASRPRSNRTRSRSKSRSRSGPRSRTRSRSRKRSPYKKPVSRSRSRTPKRRSRSRSRSRTPLRRRSRSRSRSWTPVRRRSFSRTPPPRYTRRSKSPRRSRSWSRTPPPRYPPKYRRSRTPEKRRPIYNRRSRSRTPPPRGRDWSPGPPRYRSPPSHYESDKYKYPRGQDDPRYDDYYRSDPRWEEYTRNYWDWYAKYGERYGYPAAPVPEPRGPPKGHMPHYPTQQNSKSPPRTRYRSPTPTKAPSKKPKDRDRKERGASLDVREKEVKDRKKSKDHKETRESKTREVGVDLSEKKSKKNKRSKKTTTAEGGDKENGANESSPKKSKDLREKLKRKKSATVEEPMETINEAVDDTRTVEQAEQITTAVPMKRKHSNFISKDTLKYNVIPLRMEDFSDVTATTDTSFESTDLNKTVVRKDSAEDTRAPPKKAKLQDDDTNSEVFKRESTPTEDEIEDSIRKMETIDTPEPTIKTEDNTQLCDAEQGKSTPSVSQENKSNIPTINNLTTDQEPIRVKPKFSPKIESKVMVKKSKSVVVSPVKREKGKADGLMVAPPETSRWERDDSGQDSDTRDTVKSRLGSRISKPKETLPKHILESAEKALTQKPRAIMSISSTVSSSKPNTRKVIVDRDRHEKSPVSTTLESSKSGRKVVSDTRSMQVTISSDTKLKESRLIKDSNTFRKSNESDDRKRDRPSESNTLRKSNEPDDRKRDRPSESNTLRKSNEPDDRKRDRPSESNTLRKSNEPDDRRRDRPSESNTLRKSNESDDRKRDRPSDSNTLRKSNESDDRKRDRPSETKRNNDSDLVTEKRSQDSDQGSENLIRDRRKEKDHDKERGHRIKLNRESSRDLGKSSKEMLPPKGSRPRINSTDSRENSALERKMSVMDEASFEPDYEEENEEDPIQSVDKDPILSVDQDTIQSVDKDTAVSSGESLMSPEDKKVSKKKKKERSRSRSSSPTSDSKKHKHKKKKHKHKHEKKHKKHKNKDKDKDQEKPKEKSSKTKE